VKRPTAQLISEAIDGVGGVLNAATDREYTVFYAKVARQHLDLALDVLVDLVRTPIFDATEMEKERKVIIEELAAVSDSPAEQADLLLDELLWPEQPLGWDVAGTEESVTGISRDMALSYLASQYVPSNIVVSVAGNIDHETVVTAVETAFGKSPAGSPRPWFPAEGQNGGSRCSVLFKRTEQTHIAMATHGIPLGHPDRYAIDLLSVLLGEGMSSRLFMELRERRGLCYDVNAYTTHFLDTGSFGLYAAVDPKNGRVAVDALLEQLRLLGHGVPPEELQRAKELAKGRMLLRLEDTRSVSGWLGGQETLTHKILSPETVVENIEAVTIADVARVVDNLFEKQKMTLAVVGPHRSDKRFAALVGA